MEMADGGPQEDEVTRLGEVTCLSRLLHDRWGDPSRVTSPTWGPHVHVNRPLASL